MWFSFGGAHTLACELTRTWSTAVALEKSGSRLLRTKSGCSLLEPRGSDLDTFRTMSSISHRHSHYFASSPVLPRRVN